MQNSDLLQYKLDDLIQIKNNFVSELTKSQTGEKTSLEFIKTKLPPKQKIDSFQIMVIGGTQYITCDVQNKSGNIETSELNSGVVPKFATENIFSQFVISNIFPHTKTLVINFAYPVEPVVKDGKLDGKLLYAGKDHAFDGLVEKFVGDSLTKNFVNQFKEKIDIHVVNDTTCLTLSGLDFSLSEGLVGGVVGSGVNFGFYLDNDLIVNLEAAGFSKFNVSNTTKIIDKTAVEPGEALFEIETAGSYLFKHYNLISKNKQINSTEELSELASNHDTLAQELLLHSARLVACQIAGIYEFKNQSKLTFVMEGSLFWQGWHYKQTLEEYIENLGVPADGIEFVQIKNSGLIGAAHLLV